MNIEDIKELCQSNERLPLEIRVDKLKARNFIDIIIENNIEINNEYIKPLAEWVNTSIENYNFDEKYSKIKNIEYIGEEETFDLEIENGNSFKANGIIVHNTINLPSDATIELVDNLYRKAHEVGCKGVTIYRDGSRSGVLISSDKKDKKEGKDVNTIIKESNAPKRPKNLECDILRFTNKGEKWIGFIGLLDGYPYEIFTGLIDSFPIPNYIEKGVVRKFKNKETNEKRYDFIYVDKDGYEQEIKALSRAFNKDYWDIAKMISAVLRHGMPIPSVINLLDSLHIDGDLIGTWKAGVKRMLKPYIKDGLAAGNGENKCPSCNQGTLIFQEGCLTCSNCGYSKCG